MGGSCLSVEVKLILAAKLARIASAVVVTVDGSRNLDAAATTSGRP
jgi:hypothetical protein